MESKTQKSGHKFRAVLVAVTAAMLGLGQAVIATGIAHAADISSQLTDVRVSIKGPDTATIGWGEYYSATSHVCVPNSAQPGDTWTWSVASLINWQRSLTLQRDNVDVVDVTIADGTATFRLREEIRGVPSRCVDFEFGGTFNGPTAGEETLEIRQEGGTTLASKRITVRKAPFHDLPGTHWKQLWFNKEDQCRLETEDCMTSAITIQAGDRGVVTIEDRAQDNWRFSCDGIELTLRDHNQETQVDATGQLLNKKC